MGASSSTSHETPRSDCLFLKCLTFRLKGSEMTYVRPVYAPSTVKTQVGEKQKTHGLLWWKNSTTKTYKMDSEFSQTRSGRLVFNHSDLDELISSVTSMVPDVVVGRGVRVPQRLEADLAALQANDVYEVECLFRVLKLRCLDKPVFSPALVSLKPTK